MLPGWSQTSQTSRGRVVVLIRKDRSLVVNGDAPDRAALGLKGEPSGDVPRILDDDWVAGVQQQHRQHVKCLLRTRGDHHLVRRAPQPPHVIDVVRDGLPQRAMPVRIAVPGHERIGAPGIATQ